MSVYISMSISLLIGIIAGVLLSISEGVMFPYFIGVTQILIVYLVSSLIK